MGEQSLAEYAGKGAGDKTSRQTLENGGSVSEQALQDIAQQEADAIGGPERHPAADGLRELRTVDDRDQDVIGDFHIDKTVTATTAVLTHESLFAGASRLGVC